MALFTVFGGRGFIGSDVYNKLQELGHDTYVPERNDDRIFDIDLGIVIYCAGSGDCENDPFNVLEANVLLLKDILKKASFEKLIYISSTRVYMGQEESNENSNLTLLNSDKRRLFNLTKLVGEELCLKSKRDAYVVRPSNVYGKAINSTLFLPSIIRNAINNKVVDMFVSKKYAKDYISVEDVSSSIIKLSSIHDDSLPKIINIASGYNVTAEEIANILKKETKCKVNWHKNDQPDEFFPKTEIIEIKKLMDYSPRNVLDDMKSMITLFYEHENKK